MTVIKMVYLSNSVVDVDECQKTDMCKHNGTCINNNGSYVCDCTDGWQGQHCEDGKNSWLLHMNAEKVKTYNEKVSSKSYLFNLDVDECQKTDLCKHNGTCINSNGSYVCDCADGWQGQHCEEGKTV